MRGPAHSAARASAPATPNARSVAGVRQASAWAGPKFSTVDRLVAATATPSSPATRPTRRQPGRAAANASKHGASRPSTTARPSAAGDRASVGGADDASQSAIGAAHGTSASRSSSVVRRASPTCPTPSGTGVGNSKATGHSTSKASAPPLPLSSQRSRVPCHQRSRPIQRTSAAIRAPSSAPAVLSNQSSDDGTRCASRCCSSSRPYDSAVPASSAVAIAPGKPVPWRSRATQINRPSGA